MSIPYCRLAHKYDCGLQEMENGPKMCLNSHRSYPARIRWRLRSFAASISLPRRILKVPGSLPWLIGHSSPRLSVTARLRSPDICQGSPLQFLECPDEHNIIGIADQLGQARIGQFRLLHQCLRLLNPRTGNIIDDIASIHLLKKLEIYCGVMPKWSAIMPSPKL